jgi:hypothetical protein
VTIYGFDHETRQQSSPMEKSKLTVAGKKKGKTGEDKSRAFSLFYLA